MKHEREKKMKSSHNQIELKYFFAEYVKQLVSNKKKVRKVRVNKNFDSLVRLKAKQKMIHFTI
jgi:hypothetical protein